MPRSNRLDRIQPDRAAEDVLSLLEWWGDYTLPHTAYEDMGELETEEQRSRAEVATFLRELADQLESENPVELNLGGQQVTVEPSEPITFKLEGESDWSAGDTKAKQSIEFELVWWRAAQSADEGTLNISP